MSHQLSSKAVRDSPDYRRTRRVDMLAFARISADLEIEEKERGKQLWIR
jgi:hypothetical protein